MIVRVGNQVIGDLAVNSATYSDYELIYSGPAGTFDLRVEFTNDYLANGEDRNLRVDSIQVDDCL